MYQEEATQNTVLVFGSQALAFNQDSFRDLSADIVDSSGLAWVADVVAELPDHFIQLSNEIPDLGAIPGGPLLKSMKEELKDESIESMTKDSNLPNVVLTPLCVISHLAAYTKYLQLRQDKSGWESWRNGKKRGSNGTHVVGFCTGLLAALVVSLSQDLEDIKKYGATAIRLAMLIGAVVDAEDAKNGDSGSFSAAWKTADDLTTIEKIIGEYTDVSEKGAFRKIFVFYLMM